jgi:hypothetical protein
MKHAIGFAIAVALALGAGAPTAAQAPHTTDDAVLQWNEIAVVTIGAQPPFPSTRVMKAFFPVGAITLDPQRDTSLAFIPTNSGGGKCNRQC